MCTYSDQGTLLSVVPALKHTLRALLTIEVALYYFLFF